jgi:hypothetical protein
MGDPDHTVDETANDGRLEEFSFTYVIGATQGEFKTRLKRQGMRTWEVEMDMKEGPN